MKEKGQVILLLILIMTVALSIGLSVVQKSLVDVSTASKVEQSSRAFSAAEAGIERALKGDDPASIIQAFTDNNSQITSVSDNKLNPCIPGQAGCSKPSGQRQDALEVPPLAKEDVAQIWLSDLNYASNPPADFYNQSTLDVYWGNNSTNDKAAIAITLVYWDGTKYTSRNWYLDHGGGAPRNPPNGFDTVPCSGGYSVPGYQCYKKLGDSSGTNNGPLPTGLMLVRARLLYNSTSQPFAVQAVGTCATCFLPPQSKSITSTGVAGETQRKVNVFQLYKVVPPYFDYAIFSAGEIAK